MITSLKRPLQALVLTTPLMAGMCAHPQGGTFKNPEPMRWVINEATGCMTGAATVGTSMDAAFTVADKVCPNPKTGRWHEMNSDGTFGPTVPGRVWESIAATVPAEFIRTAGMVAAADMKSCGGDCGNTYLHNVSQSGSEARNEVDVDVGAKSSSGNGKPCSYCGAGKD